MLDHASVRSTVLLSSPYPSLDDAADTSAKPGTIDLISPDVVGGVSFSTHMMPLKIMVDYMNQSIKCKTLIIGIQPKVLKFGSIPTKVVIASAKEVAEAILSLM